MIQQQSIQQIAVLALLDEVQALRDAGYRLVQIGANRLPDQVELTYSFDLNGQLANLRVQLPPVEPRLPSISAIYGCAVLYENEIHDLFNVIVDNMALDFHGNLYRTSVKFPFGSVKAPAAKAAPVVASPRLPTAAPPATQ
jgi:ech hydrogenase subunit D